MDVNNSLALEAVSRLQTTVTKLDNKIALFNEMVKTLSDKMSIYISILSPAPAQMGAQGTLPNGNLYQGQKGMLAALLAFGIKPFGTSDKIIKQGSIAYLQTHLYGYSIPSSDETTLNVYNMNTGNLENCRTGDFVQKTASPTT